MTRLPRDVSGERLVTLLGRLGYVPTRQSGSHVRLTAVVDDTERHLTVPLHGSLRVGTLSAILADVAHHHDRTRDEVIALLFGR